MITTAARTALLCFVLLAAPAYAFAQTDLEGVWSGIFTTRHDPYWHIEDWGCFNGCSDEGIALTHCNPRGERLARIKDCGPAGCPGVWPRAPPGREGRA